MKVSSWYLSKIVTSDEKVSLRDSAFWVYRFLLYFPLHQAWNLQRVKNQGRYTSVLTMPNRGVLFLWRATGFNFNFPFFPYRGAQLLQQRRAGNLEIYPPGADKFLIQTVMVELPTQRQVALIISVFQTNRLPHVTQERMKINPPCLTLGLWTTPIQNNYLVISSIISSSFRYVYRKNNDYILIKAELCTL